jgi:hypothetical protein
MGDAHILCCDSALYSIYSLVILSLLDSYNSLEYELGSPRCLLAHACGAALRNFLSRLGQCSAAGC